MTDYLFAKPGFSSGAARVMDLFGTFDDYNTSPTPAEADAKALYNDWRAVGDDLKSAVEQVVAEYPGLSSTSK